MKTISSTLMAVTLACGIVVSLFLFHAFAVEPEYELAQPVSVNEGGQPVMLPVGQTVTVIGSPSGGTVMIRIVLPNGSLSMAQIPAASIRRKVAAAATPAPAAATPETVAATPPPAASPAVAAAPATAASAPSPAASPAAAAATTTKPAAAAAIPAVSATNPDFGPNVFVFDPTMTNIQPKIDTLANQQSDAEFSVNRYALLFKPGEYKLEVKVGFYMQVLGLGQTPDAVNIKGSLAPNSVLTGGNVTQCFWRNVENLSLSAKEFGWAVSQGTELRRVHANGDMSLFIVAGDKGGWASGGFFADCKINGQVTAGSQQQWLSRNSQFGKWSNAVWNMVFVGTPGAPSAWPGYTEVDKTPLIAEKPYLVVDNSGRYWVMVPALKRDSAGPSWGGPVPSPASAISIEQFYLAHPGDTVATINAALAAGKNLIITPGIYHLDDTIQITRPDTVVLGLGYPTRIPDKGAPAMKIADVNGVKVVCILSQAGEVSATPLLQNGNPDSKIAHAADPTIIYDICARVGGAAPGSTDAMVTINSNDVIGDNAWLWRADHGAGVGWETNKCRNGLVVNGANVIYYGLAVEHTQEYQTVWNGNGGRDYFYQSEIPYDVPSQSAWRPGSDAGYSSYKVGGGVTTHEAWGLGIYSLFNVGACILHSAIEVPAGVPGIKLHHMVSIDLGGKAAAPNGIDHVVNDTGATNVGPGGQFKQVNLDQWPAP